MTLMDLASVFNEEYELQIFDYNNNQKYLGCHDGMGGMESLDRKYMDWKVIQITPYEEEDGTAHWAVLRVIIAED